MRLPWSRNGGDLARDAGDRATFSSQALLARLFSPHYQSSREDEETSATNKESHEIVVDE
jgi:hypothetical protein